MSFVQVAFVRIAVLYLVATGVLGLWFLIDPTHAWIFRTTHVHAGVLGFFLSLVMGVAFWLLPRPGGVRTPRVEAWTLALFHGGLLVRTGIEPWTRAGTAPPWADPILWCAGAATVAGMITFAASVWGRARTPEELRRARERRA
ncbi:MAG: hypothetical protein WD336_01335 [Trueperaceae bacterium]